MAHIEQLNHQMHITIRYGYGLFIVTLAALAASVFPWFCLYPNEVSQDFETTLFLLTSVFTALVPPLAGFFSGDAATRDKSKLVRHYNGVLFGVLGLWFWLMFETLSTILSWAVVIENNLQYMFISVLPAVLAAICTTILGVFYAKSTQHQKTVIDYPPYRWTLFASVGGLIASFGVSGLFGLQYGSNIWMTMLITTIMPLLYILVVTLLGYWALGKKSGTVGQRVVYSLVAIAYGITVLVIAGQIGSRHMEWQEFLISCGFAVLALTWATYLYLLRRTPH